MTFIDISTSIFILLFLHRTNSLDLSWIPTDQEENNKVLSEISDSNRDSLIKLCELLTIEKNNPLPPELVQKKLELQKLCSIHSPKFEDVVLFGSCNKQTLNQIHWEYMRKFNAKHFIWMGDSVYSLNNSIKGLKSAYDHFKSSVEYSRFLSTGIDVDGVWDDHG